MPKKIASLRKFAKAPASKQQLKKRPREFSLKPTDEEISSDDDGSDNDRRMESESESEEESAEAKRKRLAKEYLVSMKHTGSDESGSDDEDDHDEISSRLRKDRLESAGRFYRTIAANTEDINDRIVSRKNLNGHNASITCLVVSTDEKLLFSGSKDNSIILWNLEDGSKRVLKPRWNHDGRAESKSKDGEVLCLALSTDNRFLASGGRDNVIRIFDRQSDYAEVHVFKHHRDAVTGLAFRRDSHTLFSSSLDRCLKHWDLDQMGYLETMFGHQDGCNAIDCWVKDRPVSSSSDRTVRLWKVAEESHLVFRGHKSNVDCVQILSEDTVVSGCQDGTLSLWKDTLKHPVTSVPHAHGVDSYSGNGHWISSIAAVKMSDLVATGSNDGFIRLWLASAESREVRQCAEIPCEGFVNALVVTPHLIVAGCGTEHRLGRWFTMKGNRNKITVLRLSDSLFESEAK